MADFDNSDKFIADHYASMSMQEMADHLGLSKSTISRRAKALRESGKIDDSIAKAAERETQQARDALESCVVSNAARLEMLNNLKDRLERELELTGGANLARVSSEYRKTIEEMASISTNMSIELREGREVDAVAAIKMVRDIRGEFPGVDREEVFGIAQSVLSHLNSMKAVKFTPLHAVKMRAAYEKNNKKRNSDEMDGGQG